MTKKVFAVYGASGFGKEVMPLARAHSARSGHDLYFIDDNLAGQTVSGTKVVSYNDFLKIEASERFVSIAIANSDIREKLADQCKSDGVSSWAMAAANTVVMDDVSLGEGSILCPFVTLTSNIVIGKQFHANIYSYVAHDCKIGDYVTFAPAVKCNGNIIVEDYAYIGTGAIIKQGTPKKPIVIGKGAVVGMGAVVTKNVPPGAVVIGNPAKPLGREAVAG